MLWKCPCGELNVEEATECRVCEAKFEESFWIRKKATSKSDSESKPKGPKCEESNKGNKKREEPDKGPQKQSQESHQEEYFQFECPCCAVKIRIPRKIEEKRFFCKKCRTDFRIHSMVNDPYVVIVVEKIVRINPKPEKKKREIPKKVVDALEKFGLSETTCLLTIRKKYLELIKLYHPDKVSHLASEFQRMAHEKTMEINHWYSILKEFFEEEKHN